MGTFVSFYHALKIFRFTWQKWNKKLLFFKFLIWTGFPKMTRLERYKSYSEEGGKGEFFYRFKSLWGKLTFQKWIKNGETFRQQQPKYVTFAWIIKNIIIFKTPAKSPKQSQSSTRKSSKSSSDQKKSIMKGEYIINIRHRWL